MPLLARLHVKCAFLWLLLAAGLHVLLAVSGTAETLEGVHRLRPAILHLYLVGWISQLIFGVSYWMFPRYSRERPHFSETLAVICFVTLNLGLLLRLICEPVAMGDEGMGPFGAGLIVSGVLQWGGILAYIVNTWPRVRRRADAR